MKSTCAAPLSALPDGRGVWLPLYERDEPDPVSHIGAGMGLDYAPLASLDLTKGSLPAGGTMVDEVAAEDDGEASAVGEAETTQPLTISEAKRRLAETLGVPESAIKISIEH